MKTMAEFVLMRGWCYCALLFLQPLFLPFLEAAKPEIISLDPVHGPSTGGTKVVIEGKKYKPSDRVFFGPSEAQDVVVKSDTNITATAPPSRITSPSTAVFVTVQRSDSEVISNGVRFTYDAP